MTNGRKPDDDATVAPPGDHETTTLEGTTFASRPLHHAPDEETTITPRPAADATEAGDRTVTPGGGSDARSDAAPARDRETIDPATVEGVSLEDAPLAHKGKAPEGGGSRAAGVLLIVVLTLVAAGAGAVFGPLIHGTPGTGGTVDDGTLAAVDRRIAALEEAVGGLVPLGDRVDALDRQAQAIDGRLAAAEGAPAAGDGAVPQDMVDRVDSLERVVTALATRVNGSLDRQLAALDGRLAGLEAGRAEEAGADPALAAEIEDLRGEVASVGERLASAAARQDLAALGGAVETLKAEVETLQGRVDDNRAAFALAVGQLRETVLSGAAYGEALDAARALDPGDREAQAALAALEPWRQEGVPTRTGLAETLHAAAFAAVDAARRDSAEGWLDKTVAELAGIVSIRRVDGETGSGSVDDITARAEARLRRGDLAGAIDEMASLDGAAAEPAAAWLELARVRQAAEQALDTLSARAIALVGGVAG